MFAPASAQHLLTAVCFDCASLAASRCFVPVQRASHTQAALRAATWLCAMASRRFGELFKAWKILRGDKARLASALVARQRLSCD